MKKCNTSRKGFVGKKAHIAIVLNKTHPAIGKAMNAYLQERNGRTESPDAASLLLCLETYKMGDLPGVPPTEEFTRMYLEKYKEKLFLVRNTADRKRLLALLVKK